MSDGFSFKLLKTDGAARQGVITTGRGVVRVADRPGLKRASCECYQRLEDHYAAVILDHES